MFTLHRIGIPLVCWSIVCIVAHECVAQDQAHFADYVFEQNEASAKDFELALRVLARTYHVEDETDLWWRAKLDKTTSRSVEVVLAAVKAKMTPEQPPVEAGRDMVDYIGADYTITIARETRGEDASLVTGKTLLRKHMEGDWFVTGNNGLSADSVERDIINNHLPALAIRSQIDFIRADADAKRLAELGSKKYAKEFARDHPPRAQVTVVWRRGSDGLGRKHCATVAFVGVDGGWKVFDNVIKPKAE